MEGGREISLKVFNHSITNHQSLNTVTLLSLFPSAPRSALHRWYDLPGNRKLRHLCLLAMLFLASCAPFDKTTQTAKSEAQYYDEGEAYRVYAALLPQLWHRKEANVTRLVIQRETTRSFDELPNSSCIVLEEKSKGEWQEVIEAYVRFNESPHHLAEKIRLEKPFEFLSSQEFEKIFAAKRQNGWSEFYRRFPGSPGITEVSAVGFNPRKDKALVYMGLRCGGLCGFGNHHFFEKLEGKWVEAFPAVKRSCAWVS